MRDPLPKISWLTLTVLLGIAGCASFKPQYWYLHNEANNKEMQKAQESWAEFNNSSAGLWPTLGRNQQRIAEAEILAQQALQEALQSTNHRLILSQSWAELLSDARTVKNALGEEKNNLERPYDYSKEQLGEIGGVIKKIMKQTDTDEQKLKKALLYRQRWQAKLYLLERGTQELLVREVSRRKGLEVKKPGEILDDILNNEKIVVHDAEGNAQEKTLKDLLKNDEDLELAKLFLDPPKGKGWADLVKSTYEKKWPWQFGEPPGLDYEIVALGADLGRVELDRAQAVEKRLREEVTLVETRKKEIDWTLQWADTTIGWLEAMQKPSAKDIPKDAVLIPMEENILESINRSLKSKTFFDTHGLIQSLESYVLMKDADTLQKDRYDVLLASLRHKYELQDSAINARQREALLQRGLEALSVYHAGGITQTEVAQIIRAAQAVAVTVIAARL